MITVRMSASRIKSGQQSGDPPEVLREAFAISPEFAEDVYKRLLESDCQISMSFEQYGRLVYFCQIRNCQGLIVGRPTPFEFAITVCDLEIPDPPLI